MSYPSPFTFVGVSSAAEVASGNLTLVTTGVTIQTGDLVVACIAARGNAAFSAPDASWSIVEQQTSGNTATDSTSIASGVMMVCASWPASPPSLVFGRTGGDVGRGVLMVYRGQKASGSLDVHSSATLASASVTAATGTITTSEDSELLVAMVAGARNNTTSAFRAVTDPTTQSGATDTLDSGIEGIWTERHDSNTTTGADTAIAVADAVKSSAGATGELRATHASTARHVMIVAAFKNSSTDRSTVQVSKASRYDVMEANDAAISTTKLSRYDVFMAVGKVSVTKFSRYDILLAPEDTGPKRRVQNVNYFGNFVPPTDPYWANVVFLSGFEGADGATAATDDSDSAHVITFNGNAQLDTAQKKFGASSVQFDGTGDYLSLPDSPDWDFGSGQFTIEKFMRQSVDKTDIAFVGQWGGTPAWFFYLDGGTLRFRFYNSGGTLRDTDASWNPTTDVWYHVAVDRDASGVIRLYIDGSMVASATWNETIRAGNGALEFGRIVGFPTYDANGWFDEPRITKGVARYGSDSGFTVPASAYPRS